MLDLIQSLKARYEAGEVSASDAYHCVCLLVEVLNNELGE